MQYSYCRICCFILLNCSVFKYRTVGLWKILFTHNSCTVHLHQFLTPNYTGQGKAVLLHKYLGIYWEYVQRNFSSFSYIRSCLSCLQNFLCMCKFIGSFPAFRSSVRSIADQHGQKLRFKGLLHMYSQDRKHLRIIFF